MAQKFTRMILDYARLSAPQEVMDEGTSFFRKLK